MHPKGYNTIASGLGYQHINWGRGEPTNLQSITTADSPLVPGTGRFEGTCSILSPRVLQWDQAPVVLSGPLLDTTPRSSSLPFSVSLPHASPRGSWNHLPDKHFALEFWAQGLFLGAAKLRQKHIRKGRENTFTTKATES